MLYFGSHVFELVCGERQEESSSKLNSAFNQSDDLLLDYVYVVYIYVFTSWISDSIRSSSPISELDLHVCTDMWCSTVHMFQTRGTKQYQSLSKTQTGQDPTVPSSWVPPPPRRESVPPSLAPLWEVGHSWVRPPPPHW